MPIQVDRRSSLSDSDVATLFDRHYRALTNLAHLLLGDRALAEDAVMEAFERVLSVRRRLRDPQRADRYLRRAVVNNCRSRQRRAQVEIRANTRHHTAEPPQRSELDRRDEAIIEAIRTLPIRQRAAIVLRYLEDRSEAETAVILGCSIGTVKSQLSKGRRALRQALEQEET